MNTPTKTPNLIDAERAFIEARESAFSSIAATAKAATHYGDMLNDLREQCGSEREFAVELMRIGSALPIGEVHKIMKVAARVGIEGNRIFLERSSSVWAQSELGIIPPSQAEEKSAAKAVGPADAIRAVESARSKLVAAFESCPRETWTEAEVAALQGAVGRLSDVMLKA